MSAIFDVFSCSDEQEALAVLDFDYRVTPQVHVSSFGDGTFQVTVLPGRMTRQDVLREFEEAKACCY
jgi:hypothetical protein